MRWVVAPENDLTKTLSCGLVFLYLPPICVLDQTPIVTTYLPCYLWIFYGAMVYWIAIYSCLELLTINNSTIS